MNNDILIQLSMIRKHIHKISGHLESCIKTQKTAIDIMEYELNEIKEANEKIEGLIVKPEGKEV